MSAIHYPDRAAALAALHVEDGPARVIGATVDGAYVIGRCATVQDAGTLALVYARTAIEPIRCSVYYHWRIVLRFSSDDAWTLARTEPVETYDVHED